MQGIIASAAVLLCLAACMFFAVRTIIRNKKEGKSSCGGNCGGCMYAGSCNRQKKD